MNTSKAPTEPSPPRVIMARVSTREEHSNRIFDLEFWDKVDAAGRFAAAWQMLKEVQLMRGQSGELPRMQRNVARVLRRSQMKDSDESASNDGPRE